MNCTLDIHNVVKMTTEVKKYTDGVSTNLDPYAVAILKVTTDDGSQMTINLFTRPGTVEIENIRIEEIGS